LGRPRILESPPGREVVVDGRRCRYYGGTAYLGLQARAEVLAAAAAALPRYGLHAATTRSGCGTTPPLLDVEREAAAFFGTGAALHLPSGWFGGALLLQRIGTGQHRLFVDEHAHWCLREAAAASGRPQHPFAHRDPDALAAELRARLRPGERPLLLTDGVFPLHGTIAPLGAYATALAPFGGALLVDDAHGAGVLGAHGRGTVEAEAPSGVAVHVCATLSKALGGYGGILPAAPEFVAAALAEAPILAGATPAPAPVLAASAAALRIARREPQLRARLAANVAHLRAALRRIGLDVPDRPTPIIALELGDASRMRAIHERLFDESLLVPFLPAYAGAGRDGVLRIAVFATHETADLDALAGALARV
jgi:7-keto-8-aminopelargonate synthetase-like enzyme